MSNKKFEIIYFDGYDEIRDATSHNIICKTKGINEEVIDTIIGIWNKYKNINDCLYSGGILDTYLMNEIKCTQEDREIITESLYKYSKL